MIASILIFTAVLIFAAGVLVTGKLAFTVLFLALAGLALSVLFASMGAWYAALSELVFGAGLIPYLFHRVMIRLPREVQEEKRDWVFPFQKKGNRSPLPVSIKILPLSFLIFAIASYFFIPSFFRGFSSFLVKLQSPEPFFGLLWETKKLDFFVFFVAAVSCIFLMLADKEEKEAFSKRRNSAGIAGNTKTAVHENKSYIKAASEIQQKETENISTENICAAETAGTENNAQPIIESADSSEKDKEKHEQHIKKDIIKTESGENYGNAATQLQKYGTAGNTSCQSRKKRRFRDKKYRGSQERKDENIKKGEEGDNL